MLHHAEFSHSLSLQWTAAGGTAGITGRLFSQGVWSASDSAFIRRVGELDR